MSTRIEARNKMYRGIVTGDRSLLRNQNHLANCVTWNRTEKVQHKMFAKCLTLKTPRCGRSSQTSQEFSTINQKYQTRCKSQRSIKNLDLQLRRTVEKKATENICTSGKQAGSWRNVFPGRLVGKVESSSRNRDGI